MKIAIDCRSFRKKNAGTSNFLLSVINHWSSFKPDWTFYLLSNEDFSPEIKAALTQNQNVILHIQPLPFLKGIATVWYFSKIYFILKKLKPDLFFTPTPNLPPFRPKKLKTLMTVHDLVYKLFPQTMSKGNYGINYLLFNRSIREADKIWAVSNYTKEEVMKFFHQRKCPDIFVGSSIDHTIFYQKEIYKEEKEYFISKYQLTENFLLFVGTLEPRKNLKFLLSLMPKLAQQGFSLLIVGAKGWKNTEIDTIIHQTGFPKDKVVFSGYISNEDLVKLYHIASIYVSTALNEGFGLPQLEAMACGCPVVTAHNSAMIEVVEGAGETVKGWNQEDWIQAILKVNQDRQQYVLKGIDRVKLYDWSKIIRNLEDYLN
jgi:glycosyltransferase involved in cell wall biosynthesis